METNSPDQDWFEKILEKPPAYRKKLTFFLTAIIGFLIISIWLFITSYQIKKDIRGEETGQTSPRSQQEQMEQEKIEALPESLKEKNEIFTK